MNTIFFALLVRLIVSLVTAVSIIPVDCQPSIAVSKMILRAC